MGTLSVKTNGSIVDLPSEYTVTSSVMLDKKSNPDSLRRRSGLGKQIILVCHHCSGMGPFPGTPDGFDFLCDKVHVAICRACQVAGPVHDAIAGLNVWGRKGSKVTLTSVRQKEQWDICMTKEFTL